VWKKWSRVTTLIGYDKSEQLDVEPAWCFVVNTGLDTIREDGLVYAEGLEVHAARAGILVERDAAFAARGWRVWRCPGESVKPEIWKLLGWTFMMRRVLSLIRVAVVVEPG
jgi:hypothetical protein